MYLLSIVGTFGFAWFFKKTLLRGNVTSSIMELPSYKVPSLGPIIADALGRTKLFVRRAGTVILGISIIMWFCLNYPESSQEASTSQLERSIAGQIGKHVEPIIAPLGYDWKTGIALIASFAAREVFVSTTAIIYNIEGDHEDPEIKTLAQALSKQTRPDGSPMFTPLTCLSLMIFYVFALQCLSTIAVVRRETNSWRWPIFQFCYMTAVAYIAAFTTYQGGQLLGFN
jgi:ferrous iron transport protein B